MRECEILKVHNEHKVRFKRAIQIENGDEIISTAYQPLPEIFTIHMSPENEKKLKPWSAERFIRNFLGDVPEDFRFVNSTTYTIKTKNAEQQEKIQTLSNINLRVFGFSPVVRHF